MRILFICPNWAGLATPIIDEMILQGHDVIHLDHGDFSNFKYFNLSHRILSKIYQILTKESYKHRVTDLDITRTINSFFIARSNFDVVIITEPSLFKREHLEVIKLHCTYLVATLWDSLTKSERSKDNLDLFNMVFSYDQEDCDRYNLIKISNYLDPSWSTNVAIEEAKYDVFSIMSFTKDRYEQVVCFLDANPSIIPNIYFYIDTERKRKYINDSRIKVVTELMLGDELKRNIENSKAILDLLQGHQAGLSFRVYESLGYNRKLITTNHNIFLYDIYNSDNICVLGENYKVPDKLFNTPYFECSIDTIDKYLISSWVKNILGKCKCG
ncbi:hypothetical protein [Vibrio aestuarianus]|uniref:Uncharacterized protein n=1 Tax=Vibrio aestuarianus TaxID=28171 RepID=A0ABD7YK57_9VIBR|nr:hypothetical protein [Vibrio aestuarianus]WGK85231.1 hypothetical protein PYE67_12785 [Vibrio aestuarianus]CAH8222550.1 conserved hypothetical protein [Vibrio aestuarianus]